MLNQTVLNISSDGRSTYTYKSVNCVNVNGRDVTLDLGRVYICWNKRMCILIASRNDVSLLGVCVL